MPVSKCTGENLEGDEADNVRGEEKDDECRE
jgi:hypothetical protein